jgi:lipopolysaccharide heptosyltransferase II
VLFAVLDAVGWCVVGLWRRWSGAAAARDWTEPRSLLLVQLDHLGDAILTTGLVRGLRARWPRVAIDVLAAPWNAEVFRACPEIRTVHLSRRNRFGGGSPWRWMAELVACGLRLRRQRYDLAIDVRGEAPLAALLWLGGARRRVGWDCGGGGFLLTDSPQYVPGRPEVESRQAILTLLGGGPPAGHSAWVPGLDAGPAARRALRRELARLPQPDRPLVVAHVGSGMRAKRWPVEHWRRLAQRLIDEFGIRVVLVGTAEDRATARAIIGSTPPLALDDWTGLFDLKQLTALVERAAVFVGADSGPAHLAAAVGTPVVALFSGTNDPRQWSPWGPQVTVLRHETSCSPCHRTECPLAGHPCMSGLVPERVLEAVRSKLYDAALATNPALPRDAALPSAQPIALSLP